MAKIYIVLYAIIMALGLVEIAHNAQIQNKNRDNLYIKDTLITTKNVYQTAYTTIADKEIPVGNDTIKYFIKIDIISKATFEEKQKTAFDYIVNDKLIKKKNGTIILPCRDSLVTINDLEVEDETRHNHEYLGQISFLNQYVVYGMYWEDYDVRFFNKNTGRVDATFINYPFISYDKKHIIDISANIYDNSASFSLHKITGGEIKQAINCDFKYWMPYPELAFYSKDGKFYIPANHRSTYLDKKGNTNTERQYLCMSILSKPTPY